MRYHLFLLTLITLTNFSQVGQAQTNFKYGVELGFAFSQFPKSNSYIIQTRNDKVTGTTIPLLSPLIGLKTELTIKKHIQFGAGFQYQITGERYHYHRDGNDLLYGATYRTDVWENQTFQKLCLPLTAGLTIKIWKIQPTIFIGYRVNYFLSGKYYSKSVFDHDDSSRDITSEIEFNPLDRNEIEVTVKHLQRQFLYGFSNSIGQHLKISVTVNSGRSILYSQSAISCLGYSFQNNDYLATVTYLLPILKKR